jgi:hypothetical protein
MMSVLGMDKIDAQAVHKELPVWVKTYGTPEDSFIVRRQEWTVEYLPDAKSWAVVEHEYVVPRRPVHKCL